MSHCSYWGIVWGGTSKTGARCAEGHGHFTLLIIIVQSQLCSCTAGETRVGILEAQHCEAHKLVIRYTQLMHGYDLKLLLFITSQNLPSAIVRPLRSPAVHLRIQEASRPAEGEDKMLRSVLRVNPDVLIPGHPGQELV